MGDVNIDIKNLQKNDVQEYMSVLASHGLKSYINDFTREEIRAGKLCQSCIDHACLRIRKAKAQSDIVQVKIADHYACVINIQPDDSCPAYLVDKTYKAVNGHQLGQVLGQMDWQSVDNIDDIDEQYRMFCSYFTKAYNECTYDKKVSKNKTPKKPWMTHNILNMIKDRDALFIRYKKHPNRVDYKEGLIFLRNAINKEIVKAKRNFYHNIFTINKRNIRKTWSQVT